MQRGRSIKGTLSAVLVLGLSGVSSNLSAAELYSSDNLSFELYGQVSPVYFHLDDGDETVSKLLDNSSSNTRVGSWLRTKTNIGDFDFNFETALGVRSTFEISQQNTTDWLHWEKIDLRKFEVIYRGSIGQIFAGQGSMASDGIASADFSQTRMVSTSALADFAGSTLFRDETGPLTAIRVSRAFSDFDGPRRFRLRYDTPAYKGFSIGASVGANVLTEDDDRTYSDIVVSYSGENESLKYKAKAGYWHADGDMSYTVGSGAIMHKNTGLLASISSGYSEKDTSYVYLKTGINFEVFEGYASSFTVDYYYGEDFVSSGSQSDSWGLGFSQQIPPINSEIYFGYRQLYFDDKTGDEYEDLDLLMAGFRWKF